MDENEIVDSLRNLHDLSKAINSSLRIEEVMEIICSKTARLMKADKVLLLVLDEKKSTLTINNKLGFINSDLPVKQFHNIQSFDHCIVHKGTVITMDEVLAADQHQSLRQTMPFLFDMLFAPLEIQGEPYGLLGVNGEPHEFSPAELEIFCSLGSQAAIAMENANLYQKLHKTFLHTAEALAEAINSRDPYTGGHTRRVGQYAMELAAALELPEDQIESLRLAAILHDIGKIGIDDAILRKSGVLSEEEMQKMKTHPDIGAKILGFVNEMQDVIPGVQHHHEWFDGKGYPSGMRGGEIPLIARIIAIADAFDALTTDRPYRKALEKEAALQIMADDEGKHFDPNLVSVFRSKF
ncbi:MAG: HD domain-containing phosphohydrolase [Thermodesulfobacteriota bacterium]